MAGADANTNNKCVMKSKCIENDRSYDTGTSRKLFISLLKILRGETDDLRSGALGMSLLVPSS